VSSELKIQETEKKLSRHLRIGIIGSIASGKTEIARLLGSRWLESEHIEECYGDNPYLKDFYENPHENSFSSQFWFLEQKIRQLSVLEGKKTEIIDPSLEMDRIYAQTQNSIGWMNPDEWNLYQDWFDTLVAEKKIARPDYYLVVNAPQEVLLSRVEERIKKGGRDFERWILERYPEYLVKLSGNVKSWRLENRNLPILEIDTGHCDFSWVDRREELLNRIDSHIALWLSQNAFGDDNVRLMAPKYPNPNVGTYDHVPGSGYLTR